MSILLFALIVLGLAGLMLYMMAPAARGWMYWSGVWSMVVAGFGLLLYGLIGVWLI